jgi:hypothetical protein
MARAAAFIFSLPHNARTRYDSSRMKRERKEQIVWGYVMATKGRLPTDLHKLLHDMHEIIGDVTESEVRAAIKWALREPRQARRPRLRLVQ